MKLNVRAHQLHLSRSTRMGLLTLVESELSPFDNRGALKLELTCDTSAPRREAHGPVYDCHLIARAPWLSKDLFVKSENRDFWTAVVECCHLLKHRIVKNRDKAKGHAGQKSLTTLHPVSSPNNNHGGEYYEDAGYQTRAYSG